MKNPPQVRTFDRQSLGTKKTYSRFLAFSPSFTLTVGGTAPWWSLSATTGSLAGEKQPLTLSTGRAESRVVRCMVCIYSKHTSSLLFMRVNYLLIKITRPNWNCENNQMLIAPLVRSTTQPTEEGWLNSHPEMGSLFKKEEESESL